MSQQPRLRLRLLLCLLLCLAHGPLAGWEEGIRFADVTNQAGLRSPLEGMMAHAAAWGDIDGDGDADLFVGGFADRPDRDYLPAPGPVSNRLFRNLSNGRFEQIASPAVELHGRTSGAVLVDLDNDGMLDLFVANNARSSSRLPSSLQREAQLRRPSLFRNDRGRFVDVSAASGGCLTAAGAARSIGVLDYDGDGALDLMVLEDRFGSSPHSRLCRNQGAFSFADVTAEVGLPTDLFGLALAIADINDDGRPDIFVSHSNRLFMSTRDGKYVEPAGSKAALAWKPLDSEDWPAGAVFADLNRDSRADLIVGLHHRRARNRVYLNEGLQGDVPVFRDVSAEVGLPAQLNTKSPHVEVQDFDNDGWPDLYFSAAWLNAQGAVTPLIFRNVGVEGGIPRFQPLQEISNDQPHAYFPAGPSADYDGDGRIDLFLANWFAGNHSRLLRNVSPPNRWLEIRVVGRTANRMGIGAKVRVYKAGELNRKAGLLGFQEIGTGYGFGSGQTARTHFGVGSAEAVDVSIVFPSGSVTDVRGVQTNRQLTVDEVGRP